MTTELRTAIEDLYLTFRDVPKPEIIEGCPCCIERKGVDVLLTTPLRQITPDQLTSYAASVFLTVGCEKDFFYFLPRILEIRAGDRGWWPDPEVIARALRTADFHHWSEDHRNPVLGYFNAVFDDLLKSEETGIDIDSWMCAFARLFSDVSPFLNRLSQHPTKVVEFYEVNSESLNKGKLTNNFWEDDAADGYKQVIEWFRSDEIQRVISLKYGL